MANSTGSMKTAVLYDFLQVKGGAESVTIDLCNHFKKMDMIVGWINKSNFATPPIDNKRIQALGNCTNIVGWQTIKCAWSFMNRCPDLAAYDSVIYSGSNAPLATLKSRAKKNIYYCHTPPRFVYDLKDYYLETVPKWKVPLLKMLISWFQPLYEESLGNMDQILCNSENVKQRIKTYLGIDAEVVYPPVNTHRFQFKSSQPYYLSTARLEQYKRVDKIVEAFSKMPGKNLVVASGGSMLGKLKQLAAGSENISFTGWLSESELSHLVNNCLATIYIAKDEDFGMSPVESQGAGKPVFGCNEGGIKETVNDGQTGFLVKADMESVDLENLINRVSIDDIKSMRTNCELNAQKFSAEKFFESVTWYMR